MFIDETGRGWSMRLHGRSWRQNSRKDTKDLGTRLAKLLGGSEPAAPSGFPASGLDAAPISRTLGVALSSIHA